MCLYALILLIISILVIVVYKFTIIIIVSNIIAETNSIMYLLLYIIICYAVNKIFLVNVSFKIMYIINIKNCTLVQSTSAYYNIH